MEKRSYNKRSPYWNQFGEKKEPAKNPLVPIEDISLVEGSAPSSSSFSRSAGNYLKFGETSKFPNVESLAIPFEDKNGSVTVSKAIELCQKAYFNIAYFRNTIEAMVEFSCTDLHVKCKNKTVKDSIEKWLEKIDIHAIQEQYFREYYRSGNVFLYAFLGQIQKKDMDKLESIYGALADDTIPIKYVVLNPVNIGVESAVFSSSSFVKIFNQFELYRLKNPKTEIEKQIFQSLPPDVQKQIASSGRQTFIYMPLDPDRLTFVFYKKQDYEPMAIPMGYSVLDDMEHKLVLKKMDKILAKTVESIILLVTTGTDPEKGGINPEQIKAIQNLFKSGAAARVLVSDYTTKAEFITPELEKVMGPEKYTVVNQDIKEGLQNALLGEGRFGDTFIKTKMFIERLVEGQKIFLERFLMPEIYKVCDAFGFKNYPAVINEKIRLEDPNVANKVITRLMELGILTPSEGMQTMETGLYPDKTTSEENQKEYKALRKQGLYEPLIGGPKDPAAAAGRPSGSKAKKTTKKIGIQRASVEDYRAVVFAADQLMNDSLDTYKNYFNKKDLNEEEVSFAKEIAQSVIINTPFKEWSLALHKCYEKKEGAEATAISEEIERMSEELQLDDYSTALVWHASKLNKND